MFTDKADENESKIKFIKNSKSRQWKQHTDSTIHDNNNKTFNALKFCREKGECIHSFIIWVDEKPKKNILYNTNKNEELRYFIAVLLYQSI